MNTQLLNDKKIWVVGGAGYLGSAITRALDNAGAKVVCADRPGLADDLIRKHGLCGTVAEDCDLFDLDSISPWVERVASKHGTPDGLVNLVTNSSRGKAFTEISASDFQAAADGVLTSGFLLARDVAERMKAEERGGSLVFFSSMYGLVSPDPGAYAPPHHPNPVDYGAVKAGLLQMSRYFSVYYGASGIRSNCIVPGPFPQPNYQSQSPETAAALVAKVPMKRFGRAEEIAGPTLFLLSDAASYVTGQSLGVDGGWTAW